MNRSFFHAILFIAMLCVGLSFVSTHAEAALDIHAGYANDWRMPQGDELPYTYGKAVVALYIRQSRCRKYVDEWTLGI